jgi:tRNA(Arg) A34 adenosine deaminase TadA
MSNKTLKFLNEASNEAQYSQLLMKHGCVVVKNGKIIGRGYNYHRTKTSDGFMNCNSCSCHAEISALRNAYYSLGFKGDHIKGEKGATEI